MEQSPNESATQTQESAIQETNQVSVKDPAAVIAKNRELLGELKSLRDEMKSLKDFKSSTEIEKKEQKGEFLDVISKLKEDNKTLKEQLEKKDSNYAFKALKNQFSNEAKKHNCLDPETFFEVAMVRHKNEFSTIAYDKNEETYASEDIKDVVEKLKDSFGYMFGDTEVNHTPLSVTGVNTSSTKKGIGDMSQEELIQAWKQAENK